MSISLDNALWLAGIVTESIIVGLLIYRRIWRVLPVFCIYLTWDLLANLAAFLIIRFYPNIYVASSIDRRIYFAFYMTQSVVDSALELAVLVELAWSVLRPMRASLPRVALIVVCGFILAVGAIIWPFASLPALQHATSKLGLFFVQLQHTVSILRILFFLLLAAASQLLSMSWRDRELQVATGMGFYSMASVSVAMISAHQATLAQIYTLNEFAVAGALCCYLYWCVAFAQKEAARREFTPQMQSFLLSVAGAAHSTRVALTDKPGQQKKS